VVVAVTTGPIEFISDDGPAHEVDPTEFSGADGLIQPTKPESLSGDPEASGGHTLEGGSREEVGEVAGIMARRAMRPVNVVRGVVYDDDAAGPDPLDPVTGRVAPSTINKAGGSPGELSDLAPY
jgi:hypothetical protein